MISKNEEDAERREAEVRRSLLDGATDEPTINVGGVPVPLSMAGAAVSRCIRAIQITEHLIQQGFADEDDLKALRAGLTGENVDQNVAGADGVIE